MAIAVISCSDDDIQEIDVTGETEVNANVTDQTSTECKECDCQVTTTRDYTFDDNSDSLATEVTSRIITACDRNINNNDIPSLEYYESNPVTSYENTLHNGFVVVKEEYTCECE